MKVVFISNYMTHHQLPFCLNLYNRLGDNFKFIATNVMENERSGMGWEFDIDKYPFIYQFEDQIYDNDINNADVLLCGGTHHCYYDTRLDSGKLTFRYFERLYKTGQMKAFIPTSFARNRKEHTKRKDKPVYLLCAGAYVPSDFALLGAYKDKMFKWGYFPEYEKLDIEDVISKKETASILWTGRMIDWKLGINAVRAAKVLADKNIDFKLTMIGEGPMRPEIEKYISDNKLEKYITIMPFTTPDVVREYMKKSSIYLMTSNMQEGWGAVVNEAMNSGCVVVASYGAGAVPYLIKDGIDGYVYDYKDIGSLADIIESIISDADKAVNVGICAYNKIANEWNPDTAACRFIKLCEDLLTGNVRFENEGPLSKAEVISPKKGYAYCKEDIKGR